MGQYVTARTGWESNKRKYAPHGPPGPLSPPAPLLTDRLMTPPLPPLPPPPNSVLGALLRQLTRSRGLQWLDAGLGAVSPALQESRIELETARGRGAPVALPVGSTTNKLYKGQAQEIKFKEHVHNPRQILGCSSSESSPAVRTALRLIMRGQTGSLDIKAIARGSRVRDILIL